MGNTVKRTFHLVHERDDEVVPEWEQRSLQFETGYHWEMGREEAEKLLLKSDKRRCYIIRYCEDCKEYRLSVKVVKSNKPLFQHYTLLIKHNSDNDSNTYRLKGNPKEFNKLSELLSHYEESPVGHKMKNIGRPIAHRSTVALHNIPVHEEEEEDPPKAGRFKQPSYDTKSDDVVITPKVTSSLGAAAPAGAECLTSVHSLTAEEVELMMFPKLDTLTLMTWFDENGREQRLEIINIVSVQWRRIGLLLGQTLGELDGYQRLEGNDNSGCCTRVFYRWINNNGHPPHYPLSWEGGEKLLRDIQHNRAADKLKNALFYLGVWY